MDSTFTFGSLTADTVRINVPSFELFSPNYLGYKVPMVANDGAYTVSGCFYYNIKSGALPFAEFNTEVYFQMASYPYTIVSTKVPLTFPIDSESCTSVTVNINNNMVPADIRSNWANLIVDLTPAGVLPTWSSTDVDFFMNRLSLSLVCSTPPLPVSSDTDPSSEPDSDSNANSDSNSDSEPVVQPSSEPDPDIIEQIVEVDDGYKDKYITAVIVFTIFFLALLVLLVILLIKFKKQRGQLALLYKEKEETLLEVQKRQQQRDQMQGGVHNQEEQFRRQREAQKMQQQRNQLNIRPAEDDEPELNIHNVDAVIGGGRR